MEKRKLTYENKLYCAKVEVLELERLLREAKSRVDNEYEKKGGRDWYNWIWWLFGYY
jgi:hypothetical protein